jgi:hypothetical protein
VKLLSWGNNRDSAPELLYPAGNFELIIFFYCDSYGLKIISYRCDTERNSLPTSGFTSTTENWPHLGYALSSNRDENVIDLIHIDNTHYKTSPHLIQ